MFTAEFSEPTVIDNQDQLDRIFGAGRVALETGARIVLSGKITMGSNVLLVGENRIEGPARIENGCILTRVMLGADNVVRAYSVLSDLKAGRGNLLGPFCFIRDACTVGDNAILGAHVEAARSSFASGVKISHRAFIGDATLGENVIIGAGSVFCNWDGKGRQPVTVEADAVVGSGTMLVAPVTIGKGAVIGAGSVVTKDVPAGSRVIQKR